MLAKRTTSAIAIFLFGLALIFAGGWIFTLGLAAILTAASWEFVRMFNHGSFKPTHAAAIVGTAGCAVAAYSPDFFWISAAFTFSVLAAIILHVAAFPKYPQNSAVDFTVSLSALAFIGFLGSYLVRLRFLEDGLFWIIISVAPAGINDIAAYLFGSRFGSHPLAPELSPGKTIEGFLAGSFAAALSAGLAASIAAVFGSNIPFAQGLLIGTLAGITCPLGDLAKSLIKRQFGLKNTGNLIPGHGGVLDRIDTWLWAGPTAYFLICCLF